MRGTRRRPRSDGPCDPLRHVPEPTPATLASVKLLGDRARGPGRARNRRCVALVATDNLPFAGDDEADGRRRAPRAAQRRPLRRRRRLRLLRDARSSSGRGPAGSPASRRLGAPLRRIVPARALPGGAGRPAQRGRHRPRPRAGLRRGRRPLRHEGHPRLRRRQRRRLGHGRRAQLARTLSRGAPAATRSVRVLRRRGGARAARPTATSSRTGCAAARWPRRRFRDARAMVLLDFVGDRRLCIPREGDSTPALWRQLRAAARAGRARRARSRAGRPGPAS